MLKDLVKANRSWRGYDSKRKITKEELTDMVDCARLAASTVNRQPFQYYISWEQGEVEQIFALTNWAKGLPQLTLPHKGMEPTAFIIICQNTKLGENLARYQRDVGIVAQTMLLRATEMGLGGCMIGNFNAGKVKETLSLPEHLSPMLIVAVGKPAEQVVLTEVDPGESVDYYRDENDVHYVPKRKLEDVVIHRNKL